jgi:hypothetical protein
MPYMPAMFSKKWFQAYGGYPAGNLGDGENYEIVTEYGDEAFFRVLAEQGIRHKPVQEVVCYHFKEGEKASHFLTWLLDICLPFIARASGLVTILRWAKARYAQSP